MGRVGGAVMRIAALPFDWVQARFGRPGVIALLVAPNLIVFSVFVVGPILINGYYSLTGGAALFLEERVFVGLEQYRRLLDCRDFADPLTCREDRFWIGLRNLGVFVLAKVVVLTLAALATALVLNRRLRGRGFWRAVYFFPVLLSPVVVGLIWKWILQRDGALNALLVSLGAEPMLWLAEPGWAMAWSVFVSVWAHLGFYALILLAGLQAIPADLHEAAAMDGTRPMRVFFRITLPLLWPSLLVVLVLATIRAVQVFDEVFVLTGGGPGTATTFLVQYIYETGFAAQIRNLGLAAAASMLMAGGLIVLTLAQVLLTTWRDRHGAVR
jgi:alpha-1,4-digalacturonate transport system permease protein